MRAGKVPLRVLLVEDNPDDAALVMDALNPPDPLCSYQVLTMQTLQAAVALLEVESFDVVLLDLSLPDSTGLRAVDRIELAAPALPMVVLSGSDDEGLAVQAVQKHAQDYLIKGKTPPAVLKRALQYAIERKKFTNALQEQNRKLEELDRIKSEFVAVVTHELRTPMSAIQLSMQLLDEGLLGSLNGEQKEFLQVLRRNTDRLSTLITDVLSISRIESGQFKLDPRACDLNRLIDDVVGLMEVQAEARVSTLTARLDQGVRYVWCDPDAITQVLLNLVGNALQHNPPGTEVVIRVAIRNPQIILSVEDNGKGIPLESQEDIFKPFFQIRSGHTRRKSGTGLGLTICKGLTAAHRTQLTLSSSPGQGSSFRFALPIYAPIQRALERRKESRLGPLTVLVEKYGAIAGLRIRGRLDATAYRDFRRLAEEVFDECSPQLALDLQDCEGLDSMGQGLILEIRAEALRRGGNLVLCALPEAVRKWVDQVGLSRTIPCFSSLCLGIGFLGGQSTSGPGKGRDPEQMAESAEA